MFSFLSQSRWLHFLITHKRTYCMQFPLRYYYYTSYQFVRFRARARLSRLWFSTQTTTLLQSSRLYREFSFPRAWYLMSDREQLITGLLNASQYTENAPLLSFHKSGYARTGRSPRVKPANRPIREARIARLISARRSPADKGNDVHISRAKGLPIKG